jgi:putative alpha-1,2-mannosidase
MTMVGDPAGPLIASAAAFGAAGFDRHAALAAMLKGAEEECRSPNGEYLERQGLGPYLARGYVPYDLDTNTRNANSLIGSPDDVWGSASTTLEYAVDDFAIAQFAARALHDRTAYGRLAEALRQEQRRDRAALRKWLLSSGIQQPQRRRLRRG